MWALFAYGGCIKHLRDKQNNQVGSKIHVKHIEVNFQDLVLHKYVCDKSGHHGKINNVEVKPWNLAVLSEQIFDMDPMKVEL